MVDQRALPGAIDAAVDPLVGLEDLLLPGVPVAVVRERLGSAPGNEIESGKFANPASSAALVANAFGWFVEQPAALPPLPGLDEPSWSPTAVLIEETLRFPWSGGRHPWLDVVIETPTAFIAVESKRYEPFRPKGVSSLSKAYWRPVWGDCMKGFEAVRDGLASNDHPFRHLDAAQLVKHAFGLRSAVHHRDGPRKGLRPVLVYLYAEPAAWPDGRPIPAADITAHREEVEFFARMVTGDEVGFAALSWSTLLSDWSETANEEVRQHAAEVKLRFAIH